MENLLKDILKMSLTETKKPQLLQLNFALIDLFIFILHLCSKVLCDCQQCDPHTITGEEKQNDINLDEATKELCSMANAEFVMRPYQLCYAAAGKYTYVRFCCLHYSNANDDTNIIH